MKNDVLEGKYVVCRCLFAGVHAGYLIRQDGDMVELRDSRRLWLWKSKKKSVALSGVAQSGLGEGCKVDVVNPFIRLTGVNETILASEEAEKSINEYE